MSLLVRYLDVPVGAQEAAAAAAASVQPFGSAQQLVTGAEDVAWATLEQGSWALDGTRMLLPDVPSQIGWWSENRSGGDGNFADPPVISITFSQPYTATGLTFTFWPALGQWCSHVQVRWYGGQNLLSEVTAFPDSSQWVLDRGAEGFDRIEITLLATNVPGQFAKIGQIWMGQVVEFGQSEIVRVNLLNEVDPSMCELRVDTMTVEIRDRKNRALMPQKNQSMHLFRNGEQIAAHYITDSGRESRENYTFRCQSAIGRLEDGFAGGVYRDRPVTALLDAVLVGFAYHLDHRFQQETVTGFLPACTRREALQQIAFAIGAVVTTQGDGAIRLSPLQSQVQANFAGSDIFAGAKVTRESQIAKVEVVAHSYTEDGQEETFLHSRENTYATAAEKGNVITVEKATLVNPDNVESILDRLYDYHKLRYVLKQSVVVSGQQAGQMAQSPNPWGTVTEGYITSMERMFTGGGQTANITIYGKEVQV